MMKEENHVFQGLRRDNHPIRQDAKFLWDAHNIRITNREDSTLFSITNEKGTSTPLKAIDGNEINLEGEYVGHCVLNQYLVIFTAKKNNSRYYTDHYIYRIEKTNEGYDVKILFQNHAKSINDIWEKGWTPEHPIETLGEYENELAQKVYWIDSVNQPRVINIVREDKQNTENPHLYGYNTTSFDFVQTLMLSEEVIVDKIYGSGIFAPGVIQYAFTYYNKYGQESNIFYTTPLNYISFIDRGASPEETVNNSFKITINEVDRHFDYLRIYSIHRTSLDAIPTVKRVTDISLSAEKDSVSYLDDGTTGDIVDNNLLLYVGGRDIVASAMCAKDGTLFLGNLELKSDQKWLNTKKLIQTKCSYTPENKLQWEQIVLDNYGDTSAVGQYYNYNQTLNLPRFKLGETYRCGVQLQSNTGIWSEPIFLGDILLNSDETDTNVAIQKSFQVTIPKEIVKSLRNQGYKNARACVVFPSVYDRTVLCQGVLCPTVYYVGGRKSGSPYAMSSWFFRPQTDLNAVANSTAGPYTGSIIEYRHNQALTQRGRGTEVQCSVLGTEVSNVSEIKDAEAQKNHFFVDSNIVTMHSPDIEFNTSIQKVLNTNLQLKILGAVELGAIAGDIDIQTSTPPKDSRAPGFEHHIVGYQMGPLYKKQGTEVTEYNNINGGLVSGAFYRDTMVFIGDPGFTSIKNFLVSPWQSTGSLNNDYNRTDAARSAVLSKKKISNLKFFDTFDPVEYNVTYDIQQAKLFSSDELQIEKVFVNYLNKEVTYLGNVDLMLNAPDGFFLQIAENFESPVDRIPKPNKPDNEIEYFVANNEPVRMKYKSTPHLVFSLTNGWDSYPQQETNPPAANTIIETIPTKAQTRYNIDSEYTIPTWDVWANQTELDDSFYKEIGYVTSDDFGNSIIPNTVDVQHSLVNKYAYSEKSHLFKYGTKKISALPMPNKGIGWSSKKAAQKLKDNDLFKLRGDGVSCMTYDKGSLGWFSGEDKYYKLKWTRRTDDQFYGELEEINKNSENQNKFTIYCREFNDKHDPCKPFLVLAELRRKEELNNKFGGTSEEALRNNIWVPAGDPVPLTTSLVNIRQEGKPTRQEEISNAVVQFQYGDTWYSRYDCLKTYPFTQEDENQVVEIGSFMCETRVNIDGRYDRNRGQTSNLTMTPQNFNLINDVYSQKNNFFQYNIFEDNYYKNNKFQNQITWSLEKANASETDPWTNVTLANTLDMGGNKGKVTALRTWNDYLLCFQEKALSQILFNSRVQIPISDGTPIEIANSYKVNGSRLFSNNIGCSNKWSINTTNGGIYFLDSNTDSLYIFNGQLANISSDRGLDWWCRQNHTNKVWNPTKSNTLNGVRTFYDTKYSDLYFTPGPVTDITQPEALCYSEKLGQFTSLMSYGGIQAMFNFDDGFYSLRNTDEGIKLYQNNVGDYNYFYDDYYPFSISFISNENPIYTKVFDTIELRADSFTDNILTDDIPFDEIKVNNEYQESYNNLINNSKDIKKKFRVWRINVPRSSKVANYTDNKSDIIRQPYGGARIRNPWAMITLTNNSEVNRKIELHDLSVKYTI